MGFWDRLSRRSVSGLFAGAAWIALADLARAQTISGCEIGIVNGLVTIGGAECDLLQVLGAEVSVPAHLAGVQSADAADATATSDDSTQETRVQRQRDRRRKKDNQRDRRRDRKDS